MIQVTQAIYCYLSNPTKRFYRKLEKSESEISKLLCRSFDLKTGLPFFYTVLINGNRKKRELEENRNLLELKWKMK